MKKKLLSVLLALVMAISLLPVSALAAELTEEQKAELIAQGYSEEDIANATYIDEDTELTEDADTLIIVVAPVKVTIKGAKLTTGLLVAPGAAGAKVTLGENANVNAVIVMDKAEVSVEEKAVATSVTVTAPETKVDVAGEIKTVNVAAQAEKAAVTVAATAKVEAVEVSAPAAAVQVSGTVAAVTVAETAKGAAVAVTETAKVESYAVAAPDVKTEVAGEVKSVSVAETATGNELAVAKDAKVETVEAKTEVTVSGEGAGSVTVTPAEPAEDKKEEDKKEEEPKKEEPANNAPADMDLPFLAPDPIIETVDRGLLPAPQVDHPSSGKAITDLSTTYTVTTTHSSDAADNEYKVVVTATDLQKHYNSGQALAGWVGIAIPVPANTTYYYYQIRYGAEGAINSKSNTSEFTSDNGTHYDTFYYGFVFLENGGDGSWHDGDGYSYQLAVFTENMGDSIENFDNALYVFDLAFELTMADPQHYNNTTTPQS